MSKTSLPAANTLFAMFQTDENAEKTGVKIDYGHAYFTVTRAGGANTRYRDLLRERLRPHQRALAVGAMSDELANKIYRDVFAETIVVGWGSPEHGDGKIGGADGKPLDFSVENVKAVLEALPVLADDLMNQANSFSNFRATIADLDGKN